jgi:hypothetical protein
MRRKRREGAAAKRRDEIEIVNACMSGKKIVVEFAVPHSRVRIVVNIVRNISYPSVVLHRK